MEYPAAADIEEDDPDLAAIIEAMSHLVGIREALRPVLIRAEERRRCRLAKRLERARKSDPPRAEKRIA